MATPPSENEITFAPNEPSGSASIEKLPVPSDALPPSETCVICLDQISDKAVALPCRHHQFDFSCLGSWLQQQQVCPLCKGEVTAIKFIVSGRDDSKTQIFYLPPPDQPQPGPHRVGGGHATQSTRSHRGRYSRANTRGGHGRRPRDGRLEVSKDAALDFRRQVYRRKLYSLHVGSNRISRYRNLTPGSFAKDERLTARARMWIRRELQVFDFLNPSSASASTTSSDRRASNADFLLEYVVSILKSIDLKGSTGQAEELLKDFLGRENARLFLHELEAWLRSPYEHLRDWDRAVQYAMPVETDVDSSASSGLPSERTPDSCGQAGTNSSVVPRWFSDRFILRDDQNVSES